MLLSIKMMLSPVISLTILISLGILLYKIIARKATKDTVAYLIVIIIFTFSLLVMMNFKNENGEYYWKAVNEEPAEQK